MTQLFVSETCCFLIENDTTLSVVKLGRPGLVSSAVSPSVGWPRGWSMLVSCDRHGKVYSWHSKCVSQSHSKPSEPLIFHRFLSSIFTAVPEQNRFHRKHLWPCSQTCGPERHIVRTSAAFAGVKGNWSSALAQNTHVGRSVQSSEFLISLHQSCFSSAFQYFVMRDGMRHMRVQFSMLKQQPYAFL